jgi:hypothetical protein
MVANCDRNGPFVRRILIAASALAIGFSLNAAAQTTSASANSIGGQAYSSSADYQALLRTDGLFGSSLSALPKSNAYASPQYGGGGSRYPQYPNYTSKWSHLAIVAGGGFAAPVGNDTHGYETWGYNLDLGGGWNFSKRFGALFEYQFDRMKIPGTTVAAVGAQGGNINSHLFLFDPIFYFYSRARTSAYITGGGGFSRKVTNFTDLQTGQVCYYFCYYQTVPVTVASFSSNQGAFDAGLGLTWKAFGQDSNAKIFAEARYVWVDSPKATTTTDGEGTEGIIPVTFGIRF